MKSVTSFCEEARRVIKNLDPRDELQFIRMRVDGSEIIIAPDSGFNLVVVQAVGPIEPPTRIVQSKYSKIK
jgi:hypothetical protein